jgi:glycosyltransferase involved in cell wall biosynthesis
LVYVANRLGAVADDHLVKDFIAVSRSTGELNGCGLPGSPGYEVIPNLLADAIVGTAEPGAPESEGATSDTAVSDVPNYPFVLYVGDLSPEKGAGVLFEAYQQHSGLPRLVVVGKHSPRETIGVPPGVLRIGPRANAEVLALMGRALLTVVPSVWSEPFSIVALESLAVGTPVVASAVGGLAEVVIDDEVGLLVPPNDPQALGAAIDRLASNRELRLRLGHAAAEQARRYRPDLIAEEVERVYVRAIGAKR